MLHYLSCFVGSEKVSLKGLKTVSVTVSLTNPLNKPLTDIVYYIEGTGLLAAKHVPGRYEPIQHCCCYCYCYYLLLLLLLLFIVVVIVIIYCCCCCYSNLAIGKTGVITFTVTPRPHSSNHSMRNKVTLIVTAKSKQLKGLMGTATITIVP